MCSRVERTLEHRAQVQTVPWTLAVRLWWVSPGLGESHKISGQNPAPESCPLPWFAFECVVLPLNRKIKPPVLPIEFRSSRVYLTVLRNIVLNPWWGWKLPGVVIISCINFYLLIANILENTEFKLVVYTICSHITHELYLKIQSSYTSMVP